MEKWVNQKNGQDQIFIANHKNDCEVYIITYLVSARQSIEIWQIFKI